MKINGSTFFGVVFCVGVIYFGIISGVPLKTLLNSHALILVLGGTLGIAFISYTPDRLAEVWRFVTRGFLFKKKSTDTKMIEDLVLAVKSWYGSDGISIDLTKVHPFIGDSFRVLQEPGLDTDDVAHILSSRKEAVRRKYFEDAKILNNIAKYPPHLGLLGAASGMIQMMSGLGSGGIEIIGGAMAIALTATLWGIFLNNFVFLPLSDNANKAAEDEMYFRDIVCEAIIMLKDGIKEKVVTETIVSRLMAVERLVVKTRIKKMKEGLGAHVDVA